MPLLLSITVLSSLNNHENDDTIAVAPNLQFEHSCHGYCVFSYNWGPVQNACVSSNTEIFVLEKKDPSIISLITSIKSTSCCKTELRRLLH